MVKGAGCQEDRRCHTRNESGETTKHANKDIYPGYETWVQIIRSYKKGISNATKRTNVFHLKKNFAL